MAHNQSFDYSEVILDLDEITNIGHPCWEMLQPTPDVYQLFDEFNQRFFTGVLDFHVDIAWKPFRGNNTLTAGLTEIKNIRENILISLNETLLGWQSRRETIEILLHEMIHAYLIHTKREDPNNEFHGLNFQGKMNELRALTRLNITIEHNFAEQNRSKYFVWRCGGRCRYTAPYFGFVWVNDEGRPDLIDESTMLPTKEPGSGDLMWIDGADCEHQFELAGDPEEMKKHVDHWQCILNFNKFISEKRIRVKTKKLHLTDVNDNNSFELKFHKDAEVAALPIANEFYVNFNRSTMQFVNVDSCLTVDTANSLDANSSTVCMICLCQIVESKEAVLQHLEECTGVKFKFDSDKESLPMFKIV